MPPESSIAHELGVAAGVMDELASIDPFELADFVVAQLRNDGAVLHDGMTIRAAVLETYNAIYGAVALAIMSED